MAIRKNVKRIDPRYFLNEKRELTKEEIQRAIKEIAEDDPSEWGQNISSYFDEVDAHRKLSQVLEIDEEELQDAMDQMGLSIVQAETMASSEEEVEDARHANRAPEYSDEEPMMEKKRTAKGNITQDTREKYATVGKDKFPIFDKKSAESAIKLRGHTSKANQKKIINKAAKYAPAAAKKAREADLTENLNRMLVEGTLSDMDEAFRERLSGWVDAAKDLGVSVQDLLGSMSSLPGAAGEAAMQALEWIGKESKYLGQLVARDVVGLDVSPKIPGVDDTK